MNRFCVHCGNALDINTSFCPFCGAATAAQTPPNAVPPQTAAQSAEPSAMPVTSAYAFQPFMQYGPNPESMLRWQRNKENAIRIVSLKWFRTYWLLFLILCIILIESFFKSGIALGTVIWFVSAEMLAISFAKYSRGKINKKALLLCVPIVLINIGHLLFYSVSTRLITWPTALCLFAIQLTYLSKPEKDKLFDLANTRDVLTTVFADAFVFIAYPFRGLFEAAQDKNKRVLLRVLLGVAISLPIAGVFLYLFSSADESFAALVEGKFLRVLVTDLIVGVVLCVFVSAAFVGANAREMRPLSTEKAPKEVNNITLGTILLIVTIVVALYVGVQFNHWFGNAPINYYQMDEYAEPARTGFFELIVASCFLLALITAVTLLSTKRDNRLTPLIKAPLFFLCVCNLIVLYSALEKMAVYIGRSGITARRILALWFIAVIVAFVSGVVVKIVKFSFNAFGFSFAAAVVLICCLSFCDVDYYVAKNHIYLAEHQIIQNLEADMLNNLSYAAAVPIAEYKHRLENGESACDTTIKQDKITVLNILNEELIRHKATVARLIEENPVMGFNFSRLNAERVLGLKTSESGQHPG